MHKGHTKFNITRQFFRQTLRGKLERFLNHAVPDQQFRFFTFEGDDYAEDKLTLLLFDFVPSRVFVTVPQHCDLEKALKEVETLNPGLNFERVQLDYIDKADAARNRQTQELRVIYMPMKIDASGKLVQ